MHEGDEVQEGRLLGTLDPTFAAADVKQLRLQVASLETQVARDEAQLNDTPLAPPPADASPELISYAAVQRAYYEQQMAQYKAQVSSFDGKIALAKATMAKYEVDELRYHERQDIAQKVEDMRATLAAHGTGSQLNLLGSQDTRLEIVRTLDFDHNSLIEARSTLASATADRDAFIQQWSAQLSQDLVTSRNSLDTARAQLEKALKHKDLVRLTAAEPSVVLTIAQLSVGSVLKEGDTFMTLMPADAPLEAEVKIGSRDIGFVRPGDHCVVKIDAFNYMEHGVADGAVRWISDNAFTTDDDGKTVEAYLQGALQRRRVAFPERAAEVPADSGHDAAGRRESRDAVGGNVSARRHFARLQRIDAGALRRANRRYGGEVSTAQGIWRGNGSIDDRTVAEDSTGRIFAGRLALDQARPRGLQESALLPRSHRVEKGERARRRSGAVSAGPASRARRGRRAEPG